jgi:hypothetical protein
VILHASLARLNAKDIRAGTQAHIYARGQAYYDGGRVRSVVLKGRCVSAWVDGSRARPYLVECVDTPQGTVRARCSCPFLQEWGLLCKHLVAVLLAWIAQRRRQTGARAEADSRHPARALRPFLRGAPPWLAVPSDPDEPWAEPSVGLPMAWMFASDFFTGSGDLRAEVSVPEGAGCLLVTVTAEPSGRCATFSIPRDEIPSFVAQCGLATDIAWRGAAKTLRLRRRPAEPCLTADYDADGRLVLTPGYQLPSSPGQPARWVSAQALASQRLGGRWYWDERGLFPIASAPRRLRAYFGGRVPLVYEGADIPQWFETTYQRLCLELAFRPSQAVRGTRIVSPPSIAHVRLELDGPDWLWCEPAFLAGDHRLAVRDILQANSRGPYLRLGADWVRLPQPTALLDVLGGMAPDAQGRVRLSRLQYLRARAAWDPTRVHVEEPDGLRQFRERLERVAPAPDPPSLEGRLSALRPYQDAGYCWLWFLHENGFCGLLADEMGLGKTHQAMALLTASWMTDGDGPPAPAESREVGGVRRPAAAPPAAPRADAQRRPSLIVCPTTVLDHWEDKLRRHAPLLSCLRAHGPDRPRSFAARTLPPVVLTTYALLAREPELFESVEWQYVVLDEAQKIKNPATKMARAARRLRAQHRLALTGTPLENRPMELWAIFEFLMPGYLGSARAFRERVERPIVHHADAQVMERLRRLAHPFKLRRCKADVLAELPPKIEDTRWCELTPHQAALYRAVVEQAGGLIEGLRDRSRAVEYLHIFAALTRLKRICDHPALVLRGAHTRRLASGKFAAFQELLEEALESDQKVVVFSQYLQMLDLIAEELTRRGVRYVQLRGATHDRGRVIATFQREPACRVFLGSLLAGGLGIDLTAGSVVIHYDRWWNAAREEQATDRVHRIGQSRGVQVFKLATRGTLEERIDRMIARKRAMMDAVVTSDADGLKAFSREELLELLSAAPLGPPAASPRRGADRRSTGSAAGPTRVGAPILSAVP